MPCFGFLQFREFSFPFRLVSIFLRCGYSTWQLATFGDLYLGSKSTGTRKISQAVFFPYFKRLKVLYQAEQLKDYIVLNNIPDNLLIQTDERTSFGNKFQNCITTKEKKPHVFFKDKTNEKMLNLYTFMIEGVTCRWDTGTILQICSRIQPELQV